MFNHISSILFFFNLTDYDESQYEETTADEPYVESNTSEQFNSSPPAIENDSEAEKDGTIMLALMKLK